jgi:hypothetical protein
LESTAAFAFDALPLFGAHGGSAADDPVDPGSSRARLNRRAAWLDRPVIECDARPVG